MITQLEGQVVSKIEEDICIYVEFEKKNWYRQAYLQSRNRDTDAENKLWIPSRVRRGGMNWEIGIDMHMLLALCMYVCKLLSHV